MLLLFLSSFLFSLTHPLGAFFVVDEDTLIFSFHFLLMLVLIQFPLVLTKWRELKALVFKREFSLLAISGLIGAFLYWCEFSSLKVGLPVTHVTFLLLTVPAWTLLYEYFRGKGTRWSINKWAIALAGSIFLITPNELGQFSFGYLLPVFTSLLTAGWIIYAKKSQEAGISPIVSSFLNDLFSLIGVFIFIVLNHRTTSIAIPQNMGNIFLYSAVIGVIPNLLLFYGLQSTSVLRASTVIMLEPVIAGILSFILHQESLGINFLIGAVFIVISNLPNEFIFYMRRNFISFSKFQ
jgi:drug/metabolite transporter (DMT)-like permease